MTNWVEEYANTKLPEFQRLNPNMWMQRRNFREYAYDSENENTPITYICECRKINNEEYQQVRNQIEDTKRIVNELAGVSKYEDGYKAAQILLGDDEVL